MLKIITWIPGRICWGALYLLSWRMLSLSLGEDNITFMPLLFLLIDEVLYFLAAEGERDYVAVNVSYAV